MELYEIVSLYRLYRPQLADSTAEQYRYAVKSLAKFLGRPPTTSDLSEHTLLRLIASRLDAVSPRTVRRERGDLLTLWRFAWRRKQAPNDPRDAEIPAIVIPEDPPIALTIEQAKALLVACELERGEIRGTGIPKPVWWKSLLTALYWSGARVSAALACQWTDWDAAGNVLTLRAGTAKTRVGQVAVMPGEASCLLRQMRQAQQFDATAIWPWPYTRRQLFATFKRIVRRAGLPADRYHAFHSIRRTTATWACRCGSLEIAQRALGHANPSMTRRYVDPRLIVSPLSLTLPSLIG